MKGMMPAINTTAMRKAVGPQAGQVGGSNGKTRKAIMAANPAANAKFNSRPRKARMSPRTPLIATILMLLSSYTIAPKDMKLDRSTKDLTQVGLKFMRQVRQHASQGNGRQLTLCAF